MRRADSELAFTAIVVLAIFADIVALIFWPSDIVTLYQALQPVQAPAIHSSLHYAPKPVKDSTPPKERETEDGLCVAPEGGNAGIHQWGGMDDLGAYDPDCGDHGDEEDTPEQKDPKAPDPEQDNDAWPV